MPQLETATLRTKKGVRYMVLDPETEVTLWTTFVQYGDEPALQRGGQAFKDAELRMKKMAVTIAKQRTAAV